MFDQPSTSSQADQPAVTSPGGPPDTANRLSRSRFETEPHGDYEREIQPDQASFQDNLQQTEFREEYFAVYNEMLVDPDRQEYVFYEVHEAGSSRPEMLKYGGKMNLVGVCLYDEVSGRHYLVSHDALDRSVGNMGKVFLELGHLKERPTPEEIVELKGLLTWKSGKNLLEVHTCCVIFDDVADRYVEFLRGLMVRFRPI